jgi:hypothetical protein
MQKFIDELTSNSPLKLEVVSSTIRGTISMNQHGGFEEVLAGNTQGRKLTSYLRFLLALSPDFMPMQQELILYLPTSNAGVFQPEKCEIAIFHSLT